MAGLIVATALTAVGSGAQADPSPSGLFTTLYKFKGGADGAGPQGELVADSKGVLYGTTVFGGTFGKGTIFSLTHVSGNTWTHKVIYNFTGSSGANPMSGVIIDDATGALYATASSGGNSNSHCTGCGTVLKLTPNASKTSWTPNAIYKFNGGADGHEPRARLLREKSTGILYGTTYSGGTSKNFGTVFRLTPTSAAQTSFTESIVYRFTGGSDGANPQGGLIFDSNAGVLLGMTSREGNKLGQCSQDSRGCGTVFRLAKKSPPPFTKTNLYVFKSSNDGMEPIGQLVLTGNTLYGATRLGGKNGQGSVFRMSASSAAHTTWTENLVYSFKAGTDGKGPWGVTRNTNGKLLSLTESGGDAGGPVFGGTVAEVTPIGSGGTEFVGHRFTGGSDGSTPQGTLMLRNGVFYGTAFEGGDASSSGVIFQYILCPC